MGLKFSCLQIQKQTRTPETTHKGSRCKQRIPPPPPRRTNTRTIPPPPPRLQINANDTAQTQSKYKNIRVQIINHNYNQLNIPSPDSQPIRHTHTRHHKNMPSLTQTTAISALSTVSVMSLLSTLSSNETEPHTQTETSLSIYTSHNETSISTGNPASPIAHSETSYNPMRFLNMAHLISGPPTPNEPQSMTETDMCTMTCTDSDCSTQSKSESENTFIKYDSDSSDENECKHTQRPSNDMQSYLNLSDKNTSHSSFLSPNTAMNIPNRVSVTTRLSQLIDESSVKIITLTQTMDIKDVKPCDLPNEEMLHMYNNGRISVQSMSSVTPKPVSVSENCYEICGRKLGIEDITQCLEDRECCTQWQTNDGNAYVD